MSEFSISAGKRIIKKQGNKRVSKDASKELIEILERFAGDVAEEAIAVAQEEDYETVKQEHLKRALT